MVVCHCKAVKEHEIRAAVRSGAHCPRQVARACKAGGMCGGCRPVIEEIIASERTTAPLFVLAEELAATG